MLARKLRAFRNRYISYSPLPGVKALWPFFTNLAVWASLMEATEEEEQLWRIDVFWWALDHDYYTWE